MFMACSRYPERVALLPQRLSHKVARRSAMVIPWSRRAPPHGGYRAAPRRAVALCPHGCVIAGRSIDIRVPRSCLPCRQKADGGAVW